MVYLFGQQPNPETIQKSRTQPHAIPTFSVRKVHKPPSIHPSNQSMYLKLLKTMTTRQRYNTNTKGRKKWQREKWKQQADSSGVRRGARAQTNVLIGEQRVASDEIEKDGIFCADLRAIILPWKAKRAKGFLSFFPSVYKKKQFPHKFVEHWNRNKNCLTLL